MMSLIFLFSLGCASNGLNSDKPHHLKHGFRNIHDYQGPNFFNFLTWQWNRLWKDIPGPEAYDFPLAENDSDFLRTNRKETTLTWIGHATVLLQLEGKNILTDPHFSRRASPVQWAGPQRVVPPGLSLADLPIIDMVIITHDHYDSLDKQTVLRLRQREAGDRTIFFVPLGLKSWFQDLGIDQVVEMDWWDQYEQADLTFIAVPVQHWSKRGLFSRNETLWVGWVVQSASFNFLLVGDSGYTPHFQEIGDRLGPFDLAAIPIGAYEPRWFMRPHHITPEEAIQVHRDVRSKKSVAIHWGTFILTDEPLDEPPERLAEARQQAGISPDEFMTLQHGETIILD